MPAMGEARRAIATLWTRALAPVPLHPRDDPIPWRTTQKALMEERYALKRSSCDAARVIDGVERLAGKMRSVGEREGD